MLHILQLFGRSPFAPLQNHMEKVSECVHLLKALFKALLEDNFIELQKIASVISETEHQADIIKNDIRNHLPSSLFLPIERAVFLDMLTLQDTLADRAEDVSVLISLRPMKFLQPFQQRYLVFLSKNIECFDFAYSIIQEIHELVESSFGGVEAEKVKTMCDKVFFFRTRGRHFAKKTFAKPF